MEWILEREKFRKIEEVVMYLLGLSLFLGYPIIKIFVPIVVLILIVRKKIFKEKLDCGNKKIKNYIIFYLIMGVFWNFLGGMSYKPARAFLKMARYIPFIFFLYPLFQSKKSNLKNFLLCSLGSFIYLFTVVFTQYKAGIYRTPGVEGINPTGTMGAMVASFSFGLVMEEKNILKKIGYFVIFLMGAFIPVATKGRAPLVGVGLSIIIMIGIDIYKRFDFKKITVIFLGIFLTVLLTNRFIPEKNMSRFKNMFNREETVSNESNALRILMWENAIWRIKQKPILGSGTKNDNGLFQEYVKNMPENTPVEKRFKNRFLAGGFNDAHSMYLNAIVDNGIFVLSIFGFWFFIPGYLIIKKIKKSKSKILLGCIGSAVSFLTVGAFWMLWRMNEQVYFWIVFVIFLYEIFKEENE